MAERESNGRNEFLGRGKLGGDIMTLCIMSKCRRSWVAERESNGRYEFLGRGKLGGDIMALCRMSKCRRKGGGGWFLEEKSD